jgi:hypothetical protein
VIDDMANKLARQFVLMIAADRIFVTERNNLRVRSSPLNSNILLSYTKHKGHCLSFNDELRTLQVTAGEKEKLRMSFGSL